MLVLAVLGALAWFLVIQPARTFLESWQGAGTAVTAPQTPPASGGTGVNVPPLPGPGETATPPAATAAGTPLTARDVQRFLAVRREVRAALGGSFEQLQQVWTDLQQGQSPNILTLAQVLGRVSGSVGAARTAQAQALAREGLSAERYAEVRGAVNRALGVPDIDFAQAAEALRAGRLPDLSTTVRAATPQERDLVAPYRAELTRLLLPRLRAERGAVVFVNSGAGLRANPGWASYAASKFALRALADALREEEAPHGVRVCTVYPGRTATPMQQSVRAQEGAVTQRSAIAGGLTSKTIVPCRTYPWPATRHGPNDFVPWRTIAPKRRPPH